MGIPYDEYYDRLRLLCEDINDVKVLKDHLSGASQAPFWVITINGTSLTKRLGFNKCQYRITVDLLLIRGGVDSGVGGILYKELLNDYQEVMEYFQIHPSMKRTNSDTVITGFIPKSLRIQGNGTGILQVNQQTAGRVIARSMRGTSYQITFEHTYETSNPIII